MRVLLILALALVVILLRAGRRRRAERWEPEEEAPLPEENAGQEPVPEPPQEPEPAPGAELPIPGAYRKRWLFSYREKDAYWAIRELCDRYGLFLMAKVRLLDLLEPVKGDPRYRSYFWKVQAKHVDFVLCDRKLVARLVVEVDDASHDQEDRRERDRFVDAVLESVGYSVLHLRSLEMQPLEERVRAVFRLKETERNA